MAILDDILNRHKNKGANSVKDNLNEQADNSPIVSEATKSTAKETMQAEQSAAQPEVKYPNKPPGLNDGEYEHLLKYSNPEAIERAYSPFDPEKGDNLFQRYYEMTATKPTPPDEKKLRKKRILADITDGAGMLAQLISASAGAHMRERNDFASTAVADQEKDEKNKYMQLSLRYNDGMYQARLRDFQRNLDDYNANRKGIQGVIAAKNKLDEASRQANDKLIYNYEKLRQDQLNKDKDFDLKKRNIDSLEQQRKAMVAQGWSRTSAYVKKVNNGNSKDSKYQMIFAANPNDNDNVQVDEFGNPVKVFELTKGQIDQYARAALSDAQFMQEHPELVLQKPDMLGKGSYKYKPNQDIAAAYIMRDYNNNFAKSPNNSFSDAAIGTPAWGQPLWTPNIAMHDESSSDENDVMDDSIMDDEYEVVGNIANF